MAAMRSAARPSSKYGDRKRKSLETTHADEDGLVSCDLPFYNSEVSQGSYRENAGRVRAGNGLAIVAGNARGYRLGEILYRILVTMSHKTVLIVEGSRLAGSVQMRGRHASISPSNGCLLHLCKRSPCGVIGSDDTVAHLTE